MAALDEAIIKRVLPHSIEAEQSVIGSMMIDKDAIMNDSSPYTTVQDFVKHSYSVRQNDAEFDNDNCFAVQGYVDIHPTGYGILRYEVKSFKTRKKYYPKAFS